MKNSLFFLFFAPFLFLFLFSSLEGEEKNQIKDESPSPSEEWVLLDPDHSSKFSSQSGESFRPKGSVLKTGKIDALDSENLLLAHEESEENETIPRSWIAAVIFFPPVSSENAAAYCEELLTLRNQKSLFFNKDFLREETLFFVNGDKISGKILSADRRNLHFEVHGVKDGEKKELILPKLKVKTILFSYPREKNIDDKKISP